MAEILEIIKTEASILYYYTSIQFYQIVPYFAMGILVGSFISVFEKDKIHVLFTKLCSGKLGFFALIPASLLGIVSPLCMYGTIPIAASFSEKGLKDDVIASFMMSSALLNPQLLMYTFALGQAAALIRFIGCFLCGIAAGLIVRSLNREHFFKFSVLSKYASKDIDPNPFFRYIKNVGRNVRGTWFYFFLGIVLTSLYQRYVPQDLVANLFGSTNFGFGVLTAAALGVPMYSCGGAAIPLLNDWLITGMSMGAAASFMITGAATKFTKIGALVIALSGKRLVGYLLFVIGFALLYGLAVNLIV